MNVTKERLARFFKRQGDLEVHLGQVERFMREIDRHQVQMGTTTAKYLTEFHAELKAQRALLKELQSLPLIRFSLWIQTLLGGQDEQEKHVDVSGTDAGDVAVGATDADGAGSGDDHHPGVNGDSGGGGAKNREAATGGGVAVGEADHAPDSDSPEPGPTSGGDNPDVEESGNPGPGELGSGPTEPKGEEEEVTTT